MWASKYVQRRLYSFLNTPTGGVVLVIAIWFLAYEVMHSVFPLLTQDVPVSARMIDNISGVDNEAVLSYGPIDAVYTWVNGSDKIWLKEKVLWYHRTNAEKNISHAMMRSLQHFGNITDVTDENDNDLRGKEQFKSESITNHSKVFDSAITINVNNTVDSNRYRDSDELRYSIRSIVKNAPWIRRIYLVTDNQIPHWLNLEDNIGRISIVTHKGS
jgi:UDP-N-acetylglucosamine-lysosomal-enzyme